MDAYLLRNKVTGVIKGSRTNSTAFPTIGGANRCIAYGKTRYSQYLSDPIRYDIYEHFKDCDDWEVIKATKWEVVV